MVDRFRNSSKELPVDDSIDIELLLKALDSTVKKRAASHDSPDSSATKKINFNSPAKINFQLTSKISYFCHSSDSNNYGIRLFSDFHFPIKTLC